MKEFWIKIIEMVYGANTANSETIKICYLIPFKKSKNSLESQKDDKKIIRQERIEIPGEFSFTVSTNSASISSAGSRSIKEFKLKLYDKKYPHSVNILNRLIIIFLLVIFAIECNFTIIIVSSSILAATEKYGLLTSFRFVFSVSDQYYALTAMIIEMRIVRSLLAYNNLQLLDQMFQRRQIIAKITKNL